MEKLAFPKPQIHVFVCVNDRSHKLGGATPSCGPTVTAEMVREVKQWVLSQGLVGKVYVTKASCLGFCNPDGGVAVVYPSGDFFKGIRSVDDLKKIIMKGLNNF